MAEQDDIRDDLQNEVFDVIGKTVTLKSKSTPVYNTRGEEESSTLNSSSITIVPYNIDHKTETFQPFGNLDEGEMLAAVPYEETVEIGDLLTIEAEDWEIKAIERNYLPDNVVSIVRLARVQA
jgi:hypothetical protein